MTAPGDSQEPMTNHVKEMVKVNANLPHKSGTGCGCTELQADAACSEHGVVSFLRSLLVDEGPTVTVTSGSDGMSVEVGHGFGVTALTPAKWEQLAADRGDQPYVVIDFTPGVAPFAGPALSYADAMRDFRHYANARAYGPHTGRSLRVMSQADYLTASEKWSQS